MFTWKEIRDVTSELKKLFPRIPASVNRSWLQLWSQQKSSVTTQLSKTTMGSTAFFALQLALLVGLICGQQQGRRKAAVPDIDQKCLDCICQASSDCDKTTRCHNAGANAYFCGPYQISWAYWHESGKPGDQGKAHDFETCLNDKSCAERSVKGYMKKHGQDCDKDGSISCYDFSRIHKLGPYDCGNNAIQNGLYWEKFLDCYEGRAPARHPAELGDGFGYYDQ